MFIWTFEIQIPHILYFLETPKTSSTLLSTIIGQLFISRYKILCFFFYNYYDSKLKLEYNFKKLILIILHVCENNVAPRPHPSQFAIWAACENNFVHNIAAKKKEKKKATFQSFLFVLMMGPIVITMTC